MLVHPAIIALILICFALIILMFLSKIFCFKQIIALDPVEEKKYFAAQYKRLCRNNEFNKTWLARRL